MLKRIASLLMICSVVACGGGGGNSGTSPFGGGGSNPTQVVANLVLQLDKTTAGNSGSDGVAVTVTATDASNNVVVGAPVLIAADSNTVVAASSVSTDSAGKVTANILVGSENLSNRTVTISATSKDVTRSVTFQVNGAKIKSTVLGSQLSPSSGGQVNYVLTDVNSNPMRGQPIVVTAFGTESAGVTDINGTFVYLFSAPATVGAYSISAAAGGTNQSDNITVALTPRLDPVAAGSILSASVSANPSVVAVNTSLGSSNQAAIRALFLGANNAPIKNVRVRFDRADNANSIDGSFSSLDTIVYSNVTGEATSAYIPGTRFSPTDGVVIRACYGYTDADVAGTNCVYSTTTTLTVVSEAISVSIGTNNKLIDNVLTYAQDFVVTVVDSSGRAKADVQITPSVDLLRYGKGQWFFAGGAWKQFLTQSFENSSGILWYLDDPRPLTEIISDPGGVPLINPSAACWNEDRNRNGVLEVAEDSKTSGYSVARGGNGNGKLDPAKSDVAISIVGSSRTDAGGKVVVRIEYAKNVGSWLEYKILVSAGGVGGTEGRASWTDVLSVLLADTTSPAEPPFRISRYGREFGCSSAQ